MRRILFSETDFTSLPNPPAGFKYIGFDGPNFSEKDENGTTTPTGGGGGLTDITYSAIRTAIDDNTLTPCSYYRITDFRTCYDQPDYNYNNSAITEGNWKQASVSPIIVFALSSNSLASDAYQPEYPNDNIKYDVSFSQTEVTGGTAYGRITYRKDERGNAFDYDFRDVLFKRYDAYFSESVYEGTVSIGASGSFGVVTGVDTSFDNFESGDIVGVLNINNNPIVSYYEIVSIEDDTNMVVTGNIITEVNNTRLLDANLLQGRSWKKNNIISSTASYEYPTFGNIEQCFSNTTTNTAAYTVWEEETFLLPNNVFRGNVTYRDNSFGHDFRNNTFNTSCDSNRIGGSFYNNIIDNDFDNNIINDDFYDNIIDCDFQRNTIMGEFYNNHFGDDNEEDFDYNIIQSSFYNNFYTGDDNFEYNIIKGSFYQNIILNEFSKNTLNGFNNNVLENDFSDSQIGESFYGNKTYREFRENVIGDDVYNNNFFGVFRNNVFRGDEVYNNNIYSNFEDNQIGGNFQYNNIGDSGDIGNTYFLNNKIGNWFYDNTIRRDFEDNQIGNYFQDNTLNGDFDNNVIGNDFFNNVVSHGFFSNHIGNNFNDNNYIGDYFKNNKIGDYFENNYYIYNNFKDNSIGNEFKNNTLGDIQYFNWDNTSIENLTDRTYQSFFDALYNYDEDQTIDKVVLGKELIMHFTRATGSVVTSGDLVVGETYEITNYQGTDDFTDVADIQSGVINTNGCVFIATGPTVSNWSSNSELTELTSYDEYHLVKFTQWTQNNNGGGFSYERAKVYPTQESTVYFTKENYQSDVDVIIEGRLEITRGNSQAIYNIAAENEWTNDTPYGTQWNSIYTQADGDFYFSNNEINNKFKGNHILDNFNSNKIMGEFGDDDNYFSSNVISGNFNNNTIASVFLDNDVISFESNKLGSFFINNNIGDDFRNNNIGDDFYDNNISSGFRDNDIDDNFNNNEISSDFRHNKIGKYFINNTIAEGFGFGGDQSEYNVIGDYFQDNSINEYFYNNRVASYFQNNTVGYYFQRNNIDTPINAEDFTTNYGNIVAFTYTSSGTTSTPGFYNGLAGTTNGFGLDATFGVTVSGGTISIVSLVSAGNQYAVGNTIIIPGNSIEGQVGVIEEFTLNGSPTGLADGTYNGLSTIGGSGSNAIFDITVNLGSIDSITLNDGGGGYVIGNTVSILGGDFGGTNSVNDITITVDSLYSDDITITVTEVSATPSVYESYNCQIFERRGGNRRLSFYDENDILTIKNINE